MSCGRRRREEAAATPQAFGLDPARYDAWIAYLFDRPETPNGWYFDDLDNEGYEADSFETVALIGCTMARSGIDLARFTDGQTYCGLNYMVNEVFCQAYSFRDARVSAEARIAAIAGFRSLYTDCLAVRCAPVLGHLSETADKKLNTFAYMLWDVSPIFSLNRHLPDVVAALVDVMEVALASPNDACIESALHGLGHQAFRMSDMVRPVIGRFLAASYDSDTPPRSGDAIRPLRPELRAYAAQAMTGCIL